MNLFTAFRKEWLESLRSYRLLIVVVVLIFFGLTSPLQAKLTPPNSSTGFTYTSWNRYILVHQAGNCVGCNHPIYKKYEPIRPYPGSLLAHGSRCPGEG